MQEIVKINTQEPKESNSDELVLPKYPYKFIDQSKFFKESHTNEKVIVIVDSFSKNSSWSMPLLDIDQDKKQDKVSHGEIIESIIKSELPKAHVIRVECPDSSLASDTSDIHKVFDELLEIKKAGYQIDAVNFSIQPPVPLDFELLSKISGMKVTPENIKENLSYIYISLLNWCNDNKEKNIIKKLAKKEISTLVSIGNLTSNGVPVYISSGNSGPDYINLYNLASGVRNVGALNAKGISSEYSADNSLVNRKARGDYNIYEVKNEDLILGYDFTGDGKVDIKPEQLTEKSFQINVVVKKYQGTIIDKNKIVDVETIANLFPEKLKDKMDSDKLLFYIKNKCNEDLLNDKFIPVKELATKLGSEESKAEFIALQLGDYIHSSGIPFRINNNGIIRFDYDNSGMSSIGFISGTSFASPMALSQDLK